SVGGPCVSPPYRADAFITTLKHEPTPPPTPDPLPLLPIPTLHATVTSTGAVSLSAAGGVSTLAAGTYNVIVDDHSRHAGFHLAGPGTTISTSARFVGRRSWSLELGTRQPYGSTFTYWGSRRSRGSFVTH